MLRIYYIATFHEVFLLKTHSEYTKLPNHLKKLEQNKSKPKLKQL